MYKHHFGLAEAPFSIAPDPRYLYLGRQHEEALAHLLYGLGSDGGFVLLTGEIGSGKTTVCRCLLEQVPPSCDIAYIFNPRLTVAELLATICAEFGIACPAEAQSVKGYVDRINEFLLAGHARGRHAVLIIDEAQNLSVDVLEQMRLLTNLETNERKLLQIILIGQPELSAMLDRPELRQLAQRVVARYHLGVLAKPEVGAYVDHRLKVAGGHKGIIPAALMGKLFALSGGVPRLINLLCDRALLGAYAQGRDRVNRATLAQAASEVFRRPEPPRRSLAVPLMALLGTLVGGLVALDAEWPQPFRPVAASTAPVAQMPPAAVESPPPASAPLAEALVWPDELPPARSKGLAHAALAAAWKLDYRGGDLCRVAASAGLQCLEARGGLEDLRRLNRPAAMQMRDAQGRESFATLTALDDASATLMIGGESQTVALGALATLWTGNYLLLWRPPPADSGVIRPGQRGPAVAWLAQQLARSEGIAGDGEPPSHYDGDLVQRVKRFQFAQGLAPDGTAGPLTLMRLSGYADDAAPRLMRQGGRE